MIIGSSDPNPLVSGKGIRILKEHGIEVTENVLKEECDKLNEAFFYYIQNQKPYVVMKCKGFPNFGIWSVKDAPFVCLEPWMGRCDDVGFDKELSEKPYINKVKPGESFEQSYEILTAEC